MKTISLWQPYAQLIIEGIKKVETRSWPTKVNGRIAIHAAKRKPDEVFSVLLGKQIPLGAIIGTVDLINCVPIENLYGSLYDTPQERLYGDWRKGRYGWLLSNVNAFNNPVNINGHQGFWNWDEN